MKTINSKIGKVVKAIPATLIILASLIGVSKGEKSNHVSHPEERVMKNTTNKPALTNEDWGAAMTAGWALHIIKHTSLY